MKPPCGFSLVGFAYGDGTQPAKACSLTAGHADRHSDPFHGYFDGDREPFLPPCFELGAQWRSYDGGATWTRFDNPPPVDERQTDHRLTVIAINNDRGEVTMKVSK